MKYTVIDRGDKLSKELAARFHELAAERGFIRSDEPDIVISIGGDGTLLQAFHQQIDRIAGVAFVGIHTGHLGFFADWQKDELEQLVAMMAEEKPNIVRYPLAEIDVETKQGIVNRYIAVNEFTLKGVDGTVVAQININDEMFEMFRGDGIVISTPVGSTAYNKSVGGAIVHPYIEALQLAEIASINNRVFRTLGSSVLLPKHHHCEIISKKEQRLMLTVDHLNFLLTDLRSIRCRVSSNKISFARYRPFPFWNRVREAFLGI